VRFAYEGHTGGGGGEDWGLSLADRSSGDDISLDGGRQLSTLQPVRRGGGRIGCGSGTQYESRTRSAGRIGTRSRTGTGTGS